MNWMIKNYMTKKGMGIILISLIGIIVALFVFLVIPEIAKTYASGKVALKVAAARDIALILDTMYAYPYDMEFEYNVDLSDFVVEISENNVVIKIASLSADPTDAVYSFVPINDVPSYILQNPQKIIFKKLDGRIGCKYINNDGVEVPC